MALFPVQIIKVIGLEKTKGMARLRFRAGSRVLSTLSRQLVVEAALNEVHSLGFAFLPGWSDVCNVSIGCPVCSRCIPYL